MPSISKVSACRRTLNSHEAASPHDSSAPQTAHSSSLAIRSVSFTQAATLKSSLGPQVRSGHEPQAQLEEAALLRLASSALGSCVRRVSTAFCSAGSHKACSGAVRPGRRTRTKVVLPGHSSASHGAARPNPSLKLSPNGGPPGPGRRYAVHCLQPGPGVPPSVPT